jgi:hypothetical protein
MIYDLDLCLIGFFLLEKETVSVPLWILNRAKVLCPSFLLSYGSICLLPLPFFFSRFGYSNGNFHTAAKRFGSSKSH